MFYKNKFYANWLERGLETVKLCIHSIIDSSSIYHHYKLDLKLADFLSNCKIKLSFM